MPAWRTQPQLIMAPVHSDVEIEAAVTALGRELGGGLVVTPDVFPTSHRGPTRASLNKFFESAYGYILAPHRSMRMHGHLRGSDNEAGIVRGSSGLRCL